MVFSSILFLYYFLPGFLLVYWLVPASWRNLVCLLGSLVFYAWGEPIYILLMLGSIGANYLWGRLLGGPCRRKKLIVAGAVVFNLLLLGVFKYSTFFMLTLRTWTGLNLPIPWLALPLGISFFTFQALSYVIDVYRGQVPAQKDPVKLALYISAFPQLVAGPIVRYRDVMAQIDHRTLTLAGTAQGLLRFCLGLGKKVLIANSCGALADLIFPQASVLPALTLWLGMISYTLQIYFDFSGYSDMAIGLGQMLGFRYQENFRYPYVSASVTEFWRRWHISLSGWFRDYLYIPLGGSRRGKKRQLLNLLLVWLATGLWHGAGWTFLCWGLYYFLLLAAEKLLGRERLERLPSLLRHGLTLLLVMVGWVIFRADNLGQAGAFLTGLVNGAGAGWLDTQFRLMLHDNGLLLAAAVLGSTPLLAKLGQGLRQRLADRPWLDQGLAGLWCLALLGLATLYLVNSTYNPFIYFRF